MPQTQSARCTFDDEMPTILSTATTEGGGRMRVWWGRRSIAEAVDLRAIFLAQGVARTFGTDHDAEKGLWWEDFADLGLLLGSPLVW